jgi:hypothetical protein
METALSFLRFPDPRCSGSMRLWSRSHACVIALFPCILRELTAGVKQARIYHTLLPNCYVVKYVWDPFPVQLLRSKEVLALPPDTLMDLLGAADLLSQTWGVCLCWLHP